MLVYHKAHILGSFYSSFILMTSHELSKNQMCPCMLMTQAFAINPDIAQLNEATNSDLPQVEKWVKGNKLSLNVMKTHSMVISTKPKHKTLENQGESLKLKIQDNELEVSKGISFWKHAKSFLPEEPLRTMYVYRYCGATVSLLLFCMGLLWCD